MSETITKLQNYKVNISYYKQVVLKGAEIEERLVEENIEIGMLSRLSPEHTEFGVKVLDKGYSPDSSDVIKIAKRFAEMMIVDDKVREAFTRDSMACVELYWSEAVQKDIERFLSNWGVVRKMQEIERLPEKDLENE